MYDTSPLLCYAQKGEIRKIRFISLSLSQINSGFHDEYHFRLAVLQWKYANVKTGVYPLHLFRKNGNNCIVFPI